MWIIGDAYLSSVWESGLRFISEGKDEIFLILHHFIGLVWQRRSEDTERSIILDAVHQGTECLCK